MPAPPSIGGIPLPRGVPLQAWLALWRTLRVYHRYEVRGLERLDGLGAALLVAYHGRPIAHDQCMLTATLYERYGYMPHGVVHGAVESNRLMTWVSDDLGFITGDGAATEEAVRRGELLMVQPGGTREGCRSFRRRYEVDWGERTGYLRLALRHRLPIVPVAATGVDDAYLGLNDGYVWGKRLHVPLRLPLWLGIGPTGLWPLSPPFPVKITTVIGEPIDVSDTSPTDRAGLLALHRRVGGAVQGLLDEANRRAR
jgi:1-acyl-sn-glycerol-3-phosphate acyltransferase